jgi:hypothetical protein
VFSKLFVKSEKMYRMGRRDDKKLLLVNIN